MSPRSWYNVVPFITKTLGAEIPPLLDPAGGGPMDWRALAKTLPEELAKQELNVGSYAAETLIPVPEAVAACYDIYRPTPLVRAAALEKALGLKTVRLFYKREDDNEIGSYKLNSAYAQAHYAKACGAKALVADTGPGNWGLGMALACRDFGLSSAIYMRRADYELRADKVRRMRAYGAEVIPVDGTSGTAAGLDAALAHVRRDPASRLSLGCLSAYSALHNTVIGLELKDQLREIGVTPSALVGVVGGGSSFSGLVFPFLAEPNVEFWAVESARVPSFTRGEYRYENPDLAGLMPRAKMYTLGNAFVPESHGASGLNYHGKNPLLSLLKSLGLVKARSYESAETEGMAALFEKAEGLKPSAESGYAVKGAADLAARWDGQDRSVVFCVTGHGRSLDS